MRKKINQHSSDFSPNENSDNLLQCMLQPSQMQPCCLPIIWLISVIRLFVIMMSALAPLDRKLNKCLMFSQRLALLEFGNYPCIYFTSQSLESPRIMSEANHKDSSCAEKMGTKFKGYTITRTIIQNAIINSVRLPQNEEP